MEFLKIEKAYDLVIAKLESWMEAFISMLPNMVVAIGVLIAFFLLARLVRNLTTKLASKISENQALNKLLSTIMFIAVLGVGIFTALTILKLGKTVTSLLAGAGIIGLALSFAFQDSATNLISGIFMAARRPFNIGDVVETANTMGTVEKMNLRNTVLQSFQGQRIYIPNKEVYQNKLVNYSTYEKRRIDLGVGVSYAEDLKLVQETAVSAVNDLDFVIDKEETQLVFDEFGDSSINGTMMIWIKYEAEVTYPEARSEAVKAIKSAFDNKGISIPFPIRTLDFGIKGGEKLSSMLSKK